MLRCKECGQEKPILEEVFDCGTQIPGNPHEVAKAKHEGRAVQADWQGVLDGVTAAYREGVMHIDRQWFERFRDEMKKRRF